MENEKRTISKKELIKDYRSMKFAEVLVKHDISKGTLYSLLKQFRVIPNRTLNRKGDIEVID